MSDPAGRETTGHLLADVVLCGPGEQAMQWHCECGAWGKPVPIIAATAPAHSRKVLAGHERHAARRAR